MSKPIRPRRSRRPTQWDPTGSREYFKRIVSDVMAFRIRVIK
jgi:hypothetical protein